MKASKKNKRKEVILDPLTIDLSNGQKVLRHLQEEHSLDHGLLPPPPNKAKRLAPKPAPPIPPDAPHQVIPTRKMMPIKDRERS